MIKGIKQASKAAACPDGDDVHSQSCGAAAADAAERGGAALSISSKRGRSSSDSGGGIHITIKARHADRGGTDKSTVSAKRGVCSGLNMRRVLHALLLVVLAGE